MCVTDTVPASLCVICRMQLNKDDTTAASLHCGHAGTAIHLSATFEASNSLQADTVCPLYTAICCADAVTVTSRLSAIYWITVCLYITCTFVSVYPF